MQSICEKISKALTRVICSQNFKQTALLRKFCPDNFPRVFILADFGYVMEKNLVCLVWLKFRWHYILPGVDEFATTSTLIRPNSNYFKYSLTFYEIYKGRPFIVIPVSAEKKQCWWRRFIVYSIICFNQQDALGQQFPATERPRSNPSPKTEMSMRT